MLETKTLVTSVKLEPQDLISTLVSLSNTGWKPAILESERVFMEMAGVADKLDLQTLRRPVDRFSRRFFAVGDVFFKESDVYYVVATPGEYVLDDLGRRVRIRTTEREEPSLEIGIVSSEPDGIDERLKLFAGAIEEAMDATFDWNEVKPGTPHLDQITTVDQEESGTKFARASLTPESIQAAYVLSDKLNRDLLIELLQAGFAREQDILNRRAKRKKEVEAALDALKTHGLIQAEYLLECKRTRTPLTRLVDPKRIDMSLKSNSGQRWSQG